MGKDIVKASQNEVVIYNSRALEVLPPAERKIIEAALAPQISKQDDQTVIDSLVTILTSTYTLAGQKADGATLAIFASELYEKVMEVYPFVTLEEIRIALRKGIFEEYGEYYGLNVKYFFRFIDCYVKSENRAHAAEKFKKQVALLAEPKMTEEQQRSENIQYVNELYGRFIAGTLEFNFVPGFMFDFLLREELVSDRLDFTRAKMHYVQNIDDDKSRFVRPSWIDHRENDQRAAAVKIVAKQMAVWEYFELCKSLGQKTII